MSDSLTTTLTENMSDSLTEIDVDIEQELACEVRKGCDNEAEYIYRRDCECCGAKYGFRCGFHAKHKLEKIASGSRIWCGTCGVHATVTNHRFIRI